MTVRKKCNATAASPHIRKTERLYARLLRLAIKTGYIQANRHNRNPKLLQPQVSNNSKKYHYWLTPHVHRYNRLAMYALQLYITLHHIPASSQTLARMIDGAASVVRVIRAAHAQRAWLGAVMTPRDQR